MKGLIIVNAYSKMQSSNNQALRLKDEFEKLGVEIDIKTNDFFAAYILNNEICTCVDKYNFCIYLDKDKYISKMLEIKGIKLFNNHQAIEDCDDKMSTYIKLSNKGINLVDTIPGLLCYDEKENIKSHTIDLIESKLGYPIVVKESFGSLGKGIYKAENRDELKVLMEKLKLKPHLFQKMVKSSYGKDMRVIVIGGKIIAAMQRMSDNDFRSNIELGGCGKAIPLDQIPKAFIETAVNCAKILNLDYCGVDLLYGDNNEPICCEVNSNAFFGGIEKVTGINVAKSYAEYIIKSL